MKHVIAVMLALFLLCATIPATAEEADLLSQCALAEGEALSADLDGDGTTEQICWNMIPAEYEATLTLTVTCDDGGEQTYEAGVIYAPRVAVLDLDGDGRQEILLSGDVMSDDYYTWCIRWSGTALYEVLFPDSERGGNTQGYYRYGYGLLTGIEGDRLTLTGSQDMLGTWFASRTVSLTPYERFEFCDDGLWVRSTADLGDDDLWEYAALTVASGIPCQWDDGSTGVLEPGDRIIVYATDKEQIARFSTREGRTGILSISKDYDRGWGCLVGGVPEEECFKHLPYAD